MKRLKGKKPLVSVIMPVYNAGAYLREALQSVLDQTYKNIEVIAYNDGSTDNSLQTLLEFKLKEPRLRVYSHPKRLGTGETSNRAITKAKGELIARMDADDLIPEGRIQKQVKFLLDNPHIVVVGGQVELVSEDGSPIITKHFPQNHNEILNMSFISMPIQQGAMMINTSLLPRNFSWYNTKYNTSEDLDLFFRLFNYGQGANLKDVILFYRQHGKSITQAENPKEIFFNAYRVRQLAILKYNYKISLLARFTSAFQYSLIFLLPESFIYPIYYFWRGLKPSINPIAGLHPLFKHAFSYII